MLHKDSGLPFPKMLLTHFKKYKKSCALVRAVGKEYNAVARYLVLHQRIDYKTLD